jgi:malonyl CoA-acyl carrier protein transacylase
VTRTGQIALLFPGQGSHVEGMRDEVERARPDLLELAIEAVGDDPFERAADSTRFAQPAIFCATVAALPADLTPVRWMAGHSLGEFAALVAAGSLAAEDGVRLVALRGRLMDETAGGDGTMVALLGPDASEMAGEISLETGTFVANRNAPDQVVLAGQEAAVAAARRVARGRGLRAMLLPVRGAFHSPLMASARAPFEDALAEVELLAPQVTVVSSITAEPFDDIRRRLADALTEPVRWRETLESLAAFGASRFVEVGPGNVLTGLVRRTLPEVEAAHG